MPEATSTTPSIAPLFAEVLTTQEAALLRQELDTLHEALFQANSQTIEQTLQEKIRLHVASLIEQLWRNQQAKSAAAQLEVIDQLIQALRDLPVLRLTLAFEPSRAQLLQWRDWLARETTTFSQPALFELTYDPAIIGGAVVMWNGQYRDFSLRKKLQEHAAAWEEKLTTD